MPISNPQKKKTSQLATSDSATTLWAQKIGQSLIQWGPLGGSGWAFGTLLLHQEWLQAILMFPVTLVTAIWAAYTKNFITTLTDIFSQQASEDAKSLVNLLNRLKEALKWQFYRVEDKYRKCQSNACQDYTTEGMNHSLGVSIPLLEEVFVPLELSTSFVRRPSGETLPIQPGFNSHNPESINLRRKFTPETEIRNQEPESTSLLTSAFRFLNSFFTGSLQFKLRTKPDKLAQLQTQKDSLLIWDFLRNAKKKDQYRQIAILAWGGYGKTTLMRHIAYSYAKKPKSVCRRYQVPELIPFLIYLRIWRDVIAEENAPTLADLITKYHIPKLPEGKRIKVPPRWAVNLLKEGRALIMLDGFDEVAENQRKTVSDWISRQIKNHPQAVFILTSRPAGYKDYSFNKLKTTMFVKPLNLKQREQFVQRWYECQEIYARAGRDDPAVKAGANEKANDLIMQLAKRSELSDMAKNPLMLNMIATFHRFYPGNELPQRRTELYREICQLQLGDRPVAKRIDMPLPPQECQQILQKLALYMLQHNYARIPGKELSEKLRTHLSSLEDSVKVEDFLDKVVKVSELLVEREPDEYEFSHLSFQNYLAATEIKQGNKETLLFENWNKSSWEEPILLYASQINPSKLIRKLCEIGEPDAVELAYNCFQESPRKIDSLVDAELQKLANDLQVLRYKDLENYLKKRNWREADNETYRLMITTVGKEIEQNFEGKDLLNVPCKDLHKIDQLWTRYSNGKFGLSVQNEIYLDTGPKIHDYQNKETFYKFCNRIGWRANNKWASISYNINSPKGHLPFLIADDQEIKNWGKLGWFHCLSTKISECNK